MEAKRTRHSGIVDTSLGVSPREQVQAPLRASHGASPSRDMRRRLESAGLPDGGMNVH
jgi:hypothetical protein